MKKILQSLFEYKSLSRQQAYEILLQISKGIYNEHEITAFMTVYLMRSVTIDELLGFRDALLALCLPFIVDGNSVIDIVGTGGDGKNTFNVSTLACFVSLVGVVLYCVVVKEGGGEGKGKGVCCV